MNIVYFSKGVRGSRCLAHIVDAGYDVKAVVGVSKEDSLEELSQQHGFPIIFLDKLNTPVTVKELEAYTPDLFILCGYNKILKSLIIDIPPLGTINLHGGKLPEYRGAAPINWQIINGETTGGCSIIYVDEGIDTGDIIAQEIYPITAEDTHASVLEKTLNIFPALLETVLQQIESGSVKATKQDLLAGQYYSRRYPRDSRIDWKTMDDVQINNLVRGMHGPYPAAFTCLGDTKIEIHKTKLLDESISGTPGRVPQKRGKDVIVLAKNRGLLIEKVSVDENQIDPADLIKIGDDLK
jgi:methionyl-tRNA formyltransferase